MSTSDAVAQPELPGMPDRPVHAPERHAVIVLAVTVAWRGIAPSVVASKVQDEVGDQLREWITGRNWAGDDPDVYLRLAGMGSEVAEYASPGSYERARERAIQRALRD